MGAWRPREAAGACGKRPAYGGTKGIVPSLIWLVRFENFPGQLGESLYEFTPLRLPCGELGGASPNGEIRLVWPVYLVAVSKRGRENVEGAPNRIDVSANFRVERAAKALL